MLKTTHVNVDWEGSGSGIAENFISHFPPVFDVLIKFMIASNFSLASLSSQRFMASLIASAMDSGTHTHNVHIIRMIKPKFFSVSSRIHTQVFI